MIVLQSVLMIHFPAEPGKEILKRKSKKQLEAHPTVCGFKGRYKVAPGTRQVVQKLQYILK
jgi:hypothetical protein